jgi:hypothetical protein
MDYNTYNNPGATPYNPITIDDHDDTTSDRITKYLMEIQMDNSTEWLQDTNIHNTFLEQSTSSEHLSDLDSILEEEYRQPPLDIEQQQPQNLTLTQVPLLVSPLLDQNHLHDALYHLLATTPTTPLNDDIIAVYGERRVRIHPCEGKKQQYRVIRYPVDIDEPGLEVTDENSQWISYRDLAHNEQVISPLVFTDISSSGLG